MSTSQLAALELLLTVVHTGLFLAGAILALGVRAGARGRAVAGMACALSGLIALGGRVALTVALLGRGWWFAADKVLVALPLSVAGGLLAAVLAVPFLVQGASGRTNELRRGGAAAALFIAGYGAAAGLAVTFLVGYPVSTGAAVAIVTLAAGLSGITWLRLTGRTHRGLVVTCVVLCVVPPAGSAAGAFVRALRPVLLGAGSGHHHMTAGTGPALAVGVDGPQVSVADLRTPADAVGPVVRFTLTAGQQAVTLPSGRTVDAWTFGSLPGPEIRVSQGDLVEVTVVNRDIADGVTLHWHGYLVPNGEDGVAGVTQDAVGLGESFTYRFVARDVGTYWYHAHQVSSEAVRRGLFGVLVVEPPSRPAGVDLVVPLHTIDGLSLVGGTDGVATETVAAGKPVRLRLINTDAEPHRVSLAGADFTVGAVDGTDLRDPPPVRGHVLRIPAGGRLDLMLDMPLHIVDVGVQAAPDTGLRLRPSGATVSGAVPFVDGPDLDLLTYGAASGVSGVTDAPVTRDATLVLDRQVRFLGGAPTFAQTINGDVHPFVPPIEVGEGDLLRLTVVNRSAETHPMHPHGHRVLVESRDGEPARGSPLWLDTFDVQPGEVWTVLLRADNPGIWMAHCHNLEHAVQGMVVHLTYQGVSTPFRLGSGAIDNRPE